MQVVLDMKDWGGLPEKYNGVSDANILVDENTGDIYVAGLWMHGVLDGKTGKWVSGMTKDSTRWIHQWREKGSQPGFGTPYNYRNQTKPKKERRLGTVIILFKFSF